MKQDSNEEENKHFVLHIGRSYICSILSSVAHFTKNRKHMLNLFTYDYPTTIPESFSQRFSYDKF
jgi:hypothetical protein